MYGDCLHTYTYIPEELGTRNNKQQLRLSHEYIPELDLTSAGFVQ